MMNTQKAVIARSKMCETNLDRVTRTFIKIIRIPEEEYVSETAVFINVYAK